jgi:hypothetical protein
MITKQVIRTSLASPLHQNRCGGNEWKEIEFSQAWFKLGLGRMIEDRDFQGEFFLC